MLSTIPYDNTAVQYSKRLQHLLGTPVQLNGTLPLRSISVIPHVLSHVAACQVELTPH